MNERTITETMIKQFGAYLSRDEKSVNTIEKYLRDVQAYVDEGNYAKIFEQALNGDVYAEYIYLVYASANGGNVENYAERFLSQGRIHTTALAISGIIGLFCFLNAKNRLEYSREWGPCGNVLFGIILSREVFVTICTK